MSEELVKELRAWKAQYRGDGDESTIPLAAEAADTIEALQAETEKLRGELIGREMVRQDRARIAQLEAELAGAREALRPFARAEHIVASVEMGRIRCVLTYPEGARDTFCLADLKHARTALAQERTDAAMGQLEPYGRQSELRPGFFEDDMP